MNAGLVQHYQDCRSPDALLTSSCSWSAKNVDGAMYYVQPILAYTNSFKIDQNWKVDHSVGHFGPTCCPSLFLWLHQSCLGSKKNSRSSTPWCTSQLSVVWISKNLRSENPQVHAVSWCSIYFSHGHSFLAFWRPSKGKDQRWQWPGKRPQMTGWAQQLLC